MKTVRVTTDSVIEVLDIPWTPEEQERAIGADCVEIVKTQIMYDLFEDRIVMLVDESGICKGLPENRLASWMYGAQMHGCFIHGDVLFARQDRSCINPLENAEYVKSFLKSNFPFLKEAPSKS